MDKISIIIPCYNEEKTIPYLYKEIITILDKIEMVDIEFIFIDDGSKDRTYSIIKELNKLDNRVKGISFSKNFGKEAAIFSGLHLAKGDCVIVMDADLQHPPKTIIEMYKLWKDGYEIIEGVKNNRDKENRVNKISSKIFNKMISKIIKLDMDNSSDFKLIDRKVVNVLASLKEHNTFFRALSYWVGFKATKVYYDVEERVASNSKWTFYKRLKYSIKNIIQFTYKPLYLIGFIGMIIFSIGIIAGVDAIISYLYGNSASGYTTLLLLLVISTGGIMLALGITGTYIAQIYDEIKGRPKYIIRDKIE